jgi:hypothetical protein
MMAERFHGQVPPRRRAGAAHVHVVLGPRAHTPGLGIGIVAPLVLAVAIDARCARQFAGVWRRVSIIGAVTALDLNVLVLIVQSFQKVPALEAMAPTQPEPPFGIAQLVALLALLVLGTIAATRFREQSAGMARVAAHTAALRL